MKLLNCGCGAVRPADPVWTNLDNLYSQHREGSPERENLSREANYLDFDLFSGPMPFEDQSFDGVALLHCAEHFDAQDGWKLMADCRRVLKDGGTLLVSVPDARYFRQVDKDDENGNWGWLFGQTDPQNPIPTFRQAALFFEQHRVLFTEDSLWCYFRQAGFSAATISCYGPNPYNEVALALYMILNRERFSLVMNAVK